jgi:hypothetical protein
MQGNLEEEKLLFLARNTTIIHLNDIMCDERNDHEKLVGFYFHKHEYVLASHALYRYLCALRAGFFAMLRNQEGYDTQMFTIIWTECVKTSLLALSCIRLVKPAHQSFLHPNTPHVLVTELDLQLEYYGSKAILALTHLMTIQHSKSNNANLLLLYDMIFRGFDLEVKENHLSMFYQRLLDIIKKSEFIAIPLSLRAEFYNELESCISRCKLDS